MSNLSLEGSGSEERSESEGEGEAQTGQTVCTRNIDEVFVEDSPVKVAELDEILGGSIPDLDRAAMIPKPGDRPHCPLAGHVTFYIEYLKHSFSVPYHSFLGDILLAHRICISQLNPQSFSHFGAFFTGLAHIGVDIDIPVFQTLLMFRQGNSLPCAFVQARGPRLADLSSNQKVICRKRFFYFPKDRRGFDTPTAWHFKVKCTPEVKDQKERREEYRRLGLYSFVHGETMETKKKKEAKGADVYDSPAVPSKATGPVDETSSKVVIGVLGKGKGIAEATARPVGKKPKVDFAAIMAKIPPTVGKAPPTVRALAPTAPTGASPPLSATSCRLASPTVIRILCPPGLGKRSRDASPNASAGLGYGKGLFRYGVNQQHGVKSLWDTAEPEVAYGLTRELISDHDAARLTTLKSDELERQTVQMVSELRHRCDRSDERVKQLKCELIDRDERIRSIEEKVALLEKRDATTFAKLKGALLDLEAEASSGQRFLESLAGHAHNVEVCLAAVDAYRGSDELERELTARSEPAMMDAVTTTITECRVLLRSRPDYRGDDFAWLFLRVADVSDNEGDGDE